MLRTGGVRIIGEEMTWVRDDYARRTRNDTGTVVSFLPHAGLKFEEQRIFNMPHEREERKKMFDCVQR